MRGPAVGFAIVRVAVITLLIVVLGLGVLYAYRSQTPAVPQVDIGQALEDINAGRIRVVTISGNTATLEFRDSSTHKERTTVPQPDSVLALAVSNYNATHPSQAIELRRPA